MKTLLISLVVAFLVLPAVSRMARADENRIKEFHLAIDNFYHVPDREIVVIQNRHISDDELPVVFFIAQRANVRPDAVVTFREKGESWMDITLHFGLSPEIFYLPVQDVSGPTYGKAFGYYKKRPRAEWTKIRLGDDDIVNLVNLRFISEHYGYAPEKVIKYRTRGDDFVRINNDVRDERNGRSHEKFSQDHQSNGNDQGGNKDETKGNGNQGEKQDRGREHDK